MVGIDGLDLDLLSREIFQGLVKRHILITGSAQLTFRSLYVYQAFSSCTYHPYLHSSTGLGRLTGSAPSGLLLSVSMRVDLGLHGLNFATSLATSLRCYGRLDDQL
jgi:hypothetical protein